MTYSYLLNFKTKNLLAIFKQHTQFLNIFQTNFQTLKHFSKYNTPLYTFKQASLQRLPRQGLFSKYFQKPHTKAPFQTIEKQKQVI